MIEKLQKKLTLLLSSVSIFLLLFMLIFPFLFNRNSIYSGLRSTLSSAINTPMYQDSVSTSYAVFQMMFDSEGNIIDTNGADFFLDSDTKEKIISDALSKIDDNTDKFYSSIKSGTLQYICEVNSPPDHLGEEKHHNNKPPTLYRVAVTDFSKEIKNLNNLSVLLILLFFILSTVIILFSKYFVKKSIRPVSDAIASQRQFISDASHELKTPLTVIINNVGNIQKYISRNSFHVENMDLLKKNIDGIDEMSERMKHLTQDLLDLSRLENWQDRNEQMGKINLSDIVTKECLFFEPLFFENSKELDYDIENNISVLGDANKIKDLISILLENAMKYSVSHTALTLTNKKNNIVLSVENDVEKELSKEDTINIFKRFYRLDESHSGTGYGLGLPIAKEIVLMHRGEIKVSSKNKKICFDIYFHI
nr:HAMP domain-containing sensor histidine kinase [uncultured Lachnoanaerobaculum sp.]